MMTEQDRTPWAKLPLSAGKFSGPFFTPTPPNIRKAKSLWNKCSNHSPQWMQLISDHFRALIMGRLRGCQRSRKALCALWGTLQGTMEKFLNIGKCFLKIKISIGMRARFQSSSIARNISDLTASCQCQFCQRATWVQWYTVSSAA